jgi:hypothetical protein
MFTGLVVAAVVVGMVDQLEDLVVKVEQVVAEQVDLTPAVVM